MPYYYYGTVPALAWILNHYFYGGVHYAWLAKEFFPPKPNPRSSNPHHIYGELKDAWDDRDPFNQYIQTGRRRLADGVAAKQSTRVVSRAVGSRVHAVCREVSVDLFYPLVYRVNISDLELARMIVSNSGLVGSREVLVPDLRETEFDLLFSDNAADPLFRLLILDEISGERRTSAATALQMLEGRCVT
jgi:hypothetical protein